MTDDDNLERLFDIKFHPHVMKDGQTGFDTFVRWGSKHIRDNGPDVIRSDQVLVGLDEVGATEDQIAAVKDGILTGRDAAVRLISTLRKLADARFISHR
jgi:hypothetical protein